MTEIDKVAVLLFALGPMHARRVLDRLSPDEMLPIIAAMRRVGRVSIEQRNAVLEEVNEILTRLAREKGPLGKPRAVKGRTGDSRPGGAPPDLFRRLGPHLPSRIDPGRIDWSAAGFDFGGEEAPPPRDRDDDNEDPPRFRR